MDPATEKDVVANKEDLITPAQKLVFLKYMQLNTDFITKPRSYPKLLNLVHIEHNRVCGDVDSETIANIMRSWVFGVKLRFNEMVSARKAYAFSAEDVELLNLVNADKQKPNSSELSCILDHLEIAYNSPKVWITIALEMEALGSKRSEDYWKKAFERWCSKVKRKKHILDQMKIQESDKTSFLSALELRVLDILDKIDAEESKKADYYCRICIENNDSDLKNIHEVITDELTLAQKISQCANVQEITKDDSLSQYICENCQTLLESAYKFKNLCEYSDQQLRLLAKNNVEYVEYILEEVDDNPETNLNDGDDNPDDEISIEMNLSDKNDLNMEDRKIIKSDSNDQYDDNSATEKDTKETVEVDVHQCEVCSTICYNKSTLKKHMHIHSFVRPYSCSVCQKDFKTKLSLRIHMRSHTGERPYVCEVCGKTFTQDATLSYHRSIHTGAKPYQCNLCDYRARNVNDLKIHMRKHTGARPYQCDLCPSKFTTSSNLQKHVRRHTGIKNFQTCGKAFKTWSAVTNHRATHSTVKQFQCQHCPYKSTTQPNLKIHYRTHTGIQPYQCNQCPVKFSTASNRHKHVKNVHEKQKMHKCSTCSRTFFSRESARKHMVIHTGLKPYNCTECSMSYGWYNGLQKHMKAQHPGIKMPTEKYFLELLEK